MKFTITILAIIVGTAYAALPSSEYLPPLDDASPTSNVDLQSIGGETSSLTDDGYRYKVVRRRLRHRRDVSELPSNEYLPPSQPAPFVADIPVVTIADSEGQQSQDTAVLANDGYRYKTARRRIRYRHRRDVSELPSNGYLPPAQETQVVEEVASPVQDSSVLSDDGYRYKTAKRVVFRRRH
ncbi:uncharacterized protein LOC142237008 [Haematobia irritans]|uniref:uncharacterized protein LOC142237008 n=1 Tax=Haematobia irritans TaxID=7368 RepID=UPI003F4F84E0